MQDLQTESLWSQISGECIAGKSKGKKLTLYPVLHTTYDQFKELYPEGQLLKKPELGADASHYDGYFSNAEKLGIFDRADNFKKLKGKDKILGLALGDKHFAVAEQYLIKNNHLIISKTTPPVIITYDSPSRTAAAFSLTGMKSTDLETLVSNDGIISLKGGEVSWNAKTGHAFSSGTDDLTMLPLITGYWFAWVSFFPNTELIK